MKQDWKWVKCCRKDGDEFETKEQVAEACRVSVMKGETTELWGVLLGEDRYVCYTGNGPHSKLNARVIAQLPIIMKAIEGVAHFLDTLAPAQDDASDLTGSLLVHRANCRAILELQEGTSILEGPDDDAH